VLELPDCLPIFPLPNCVLLPRAILPLHVFEERYRRMTRDVLAGNKLLAIALLKPCTQEQYLTLHAPIHTAVGVGYVEKVEHLPDGRFNFLLRGIERVVIESEVSGGPYRRARCRVIRTRDLEPGQECLILRELKRHLESPPLTTVPPLAKINSYLDCCTSRLSEKLDAIASVVMTTCQEKQQVLSLGCVAARAELVFAALKRIQVNCLSALRPTPAVRERSRECWN